MKNGKINRVLRFKQNPCLASYTDLIKKTTTNGPFRLFYTVLNNAFYDKTKETVRDGLKIIFITGCEVI